MRLAPEYRFAMKAAMLVMAAHLCGCSQSRDRDHWSRSIGKPERMDSLLRAALDQSPIASPFAAMDSLADSLRGIHLQDSSFERKVAAIAAALSGPGGVAPILHPSDTDLVPSLAFERHRGGCTSLALAWQILGASVGLRLEPVLLPGHMTLRDPSGRFIEPLRGIERTAAFYDSAFLLSRRTAYANLAPKPQGLEAALAIQGGLLAWRRDGKDEALDAFRTACSLVPGLPEAEGNLGLLHEAMGNRDSALKHLRIAITGDSLNEAARKRLERLETSGNMSRS